MTGSEQVLIEDWCQQYPSHSIGALDFGPDGALYVSGGDGASFNFADWGQDGNPLNPCGDPPGGVGAMLSPPTAEGGALRSQDLRTPTDPTSLDGALLRVNPANGAGLPDNPNAASPDANARRIVAYGLRNPFRFGVRPGTGEVWIGDVGWNTWEEIQRFQLPTGTGAAAVNFGWPCYEGSNTGSARQSGYDGANLNICENLYAQGPGAVQAPLFAWNHSSVVVPGETCPAGSSSAAGIAFGPTTGSNYPSEYRGALFFADYSRDCIWAMLPDANGVPDKASIRTFAAGAANPVHLQIGPGGDLFYPDFDGGTIRRVTFTSANQSPIAAITASPTTGPAPLFVSFDGTASSDPEGHALSYAWDLNGDGTFGDATGSTASYTYSIAGTYSAGLRVTDDQGASDTESVTITVGNTPPTATIDAPAASTTWTVGDVINFSGHATDPQQGTLPASALTWTLTMQHCPSNCHAHDLQTFVGVAAGSFTAPDHEYPSYLELELTATDTGGLTDTKTVRLDPRTVTLTFSTNPSGLRVAVNGTAATATFTRTVIVGSSNTISAITPQTKGKTYTSASWSDGGAASHNITAPATNTTYTARFR
jgi:glucose/arabinose dehydrogenase